MQSIKGPIYAMHARLQSIVPLEKRSKMLCFLLVTIGCGMDNFNVAGSMATFFSVGEHFGANSTTVTWTLSSYALTLGAFIMLGGKLTDILGPDVVFISAVLCTGLFAMIAALINDSIIGLIVVRAFQGVAASFTIPSSFAIAGHYFQGAKQGTALIMLMFAYTGILGLAYVIGGAFSLSNVGYKGIYWVTFAVNIAVAIGVYLIHTPIEVAKEHKETKLRNLDYIGSAFFVIGILLIILGLTDGGDSWTKPTAYVPLPIGVVVLVAGFVFEVVYVQGVKDRVREQVKLAEEKESSGETKVELPNTSSYIYKLHMLFPREMVDITNFFPFVIATLMLFIHLIVIQASVTQYHEYVIGDSPLITGVKVLPLSIGLIVSVVLGTREKMLYKIGMKRILIFTQFSAVFYFVWIYEENYHTRHHYWIYQAVPLFLYGMTVSMYFGIYINALLRNTPLHLQGVVSGFLQTVGQVGICLGTAVTATILGELEVATNEAERQVLKQKFDSCYYLCMAAAAVGTLAMLFVKNQKSVSSQEEIAPEKALDVSV